MKPIPHWPDYFADVLGFIYSMKAWPWNTKLPQRPRKLKSRESSGHHYIYLSRNGQLYQVPVGRLILETFVGPCPEGMECCHGSKGKLDDSLDNLCWATHKKNMGEDTLRDNVRARGEKNGHAKLNCEKVLWARSQAGKMMQKQIAKKLGVAQSTIAMIVTRRTWAWLK